MREVDISDLEEKMIPAKQIVKVEDDDGKVRYEQRGTTLPDKSNSSVILEPDSKELSEEDIEGLKRLAADGYFQEMSNKVKVRKSMRFAPVILLGVILTVLCHGPFYTIFWRMGH